MSESVVEMALREADAAEREALERQESDGPDVPERVAIESEALADDTEQESAPEPPSDAAAERALKQVEKAGDAYTRKVETIQRDTPLGLVECPLCPIPGFVLDPAPPEFDPGQVAVVTDYLGLTGEQSYPPSTHLTTCPTCAGFGFLATGSKRPGHTDVTCDDCMGNGYIDGRQQLVPPNALHSPEGVLTAPPYRPYPSANAAAAPASVTQGGHVFPLIQGGAPDQIGRLAGHPLWGMPAEAGGV